MQKRCFNIQSTLKGIFLCVQCYVRICCWHTEVYTSRGSPKGIDSREQLKACLLHPGTIAGGSRGTRRGKMSSFCPLPKKVPSAGERVSRNCSGGECGAASEARRARAEALTGQNTLATFT